MENTFLHQVFTGAYWKELFASFAHAIRTKKFWIELIQMTVAMLLGAVAVYYFLMPSHLIVGSISGLSIVINTAIGGNADTMSLIVVAINAFLLVLAFLLIGNEFGAKTVYTALILGPCIQFWDRVYPSTNFTHRIVENCPADLLLQLQHGERVLDAHGNPYLLDHAGNVLEQVKDSVMSAGLGLGDIWFDLICFVVVLSVCQSFLFKINASSGGLDILAKIVNKYLHFDIGTSVSVAGAIICCSAFAINDFRMVIIGLIGTWINGLAVNHFTNGLNNRKRVCIISKQTEPVRQYIIKSLSRGCSIYDVTGGYSNDAYKEIQVILTQMEFSSLLVFIRESKIDAFITAGNCSEIYGAWMRHRKQRDGKYVIINEDEEILSTAKRLKRKA